MSEADRQEGADNDPIKVLVVDDDAFAIALAKRHLDRAGYEVQTASNGADALRILLNKGASIVVTDWQMPEMTGLDLCRAIREHEGIPFCYVVIMTALNTADGCVVEALGAGADDFVTKPLQHKEFLARIRAGERIFRLQRQLDARTLELHRYNAEMALTQDQLSKANQTLKHVARIDELTDLLNRRAALEYLDDGWASANRYGTPFSCIMLDIDHFKRFNDEYGHAVGDLVLKETAAVLRHTARKEEKVARVGGEEFLVLCPSTTEANAVICAERFRKAVESHVISWGPLKLHVSISLGVSTKNNDMTNRDDLLRCADDALYAAKDDGRNKVRCASQHKPPEHFAKQSKLTKQTDEVEVAGQSEPAIVLIAHSEASELTGIAKQLEISGMQVRQACNAAQLTESVAKELPELIIIDDALPGTNTSRCVADIRSNPSACDIPVIIACKRNNAGEIEAGIAAGASEFLTKPINIKEMLHRIVSTIGLARQLAQSNEIRGEQTRALEILLEYSTDIASAGSLDVVLDRTVVAAASLAGCRCASALLPETGGYFLKVYSSIGLDRDTSETKIPINKSVSGRVLTCGEVIAITNTSIDRPHDTDPEARLLADTPSISLPLRSPERIVGVLNLMHRHGKIPFSTMDKTYLELVGNIAAAAIHERLTMRSRDEARHAIVVALAKLAEHRDNDTGKHLERVSQFSAMLAHKLSSYKRFRSVITASFIHDLERAVPLHDIGKVAVPDSILLKPGKLSPTETAVMRKHCVIGAKTIQSVIAGAPGVSFLTLAEQIAISHHEWFNGKGYPHGLSGEDIPLAGRIVAVADVYDAITTRRPYKEPMTHEAATGIITQACGRQFDPGVVDAFLHCMEDFRRLAAKLADPERIDQPSEQDNKQTPIAEPAPAV